jgi:hypothetical protein
MATDPLKPRHPWQPVTPETGIEGIPHGTLPTGRLQTILRRLDAGLYNTPGTLEIVARRVLADLSS